MDSYQQTSKNNCFREIALLSPRPFPLRKSLCCFWLLFASSVIAESLTPFSSDGCSWFPDGNLQNKTLWLDCCVAHDYAYWKGGTWDDRVAADKQLQVCVAEAGESALSRFMQLGVRVGGTPFLPTSFRWGYGWPYPRHYKALTEEEMLEVQAQSKGRYP